MFFSLKIKGEPPEVRLGAIQGVELYRAIHLRGTARGEPAQSRNAAGDKAAEVRVTERRIVVDQVCNLETPIA